MIDGNGSLTKCISPVWFSVKKLNKCQKQVKKKKNKNMLVFIYCKITKLMGHEKIMLWDDIL